jgi:ABC-type phosphate transport system substrate-binding protein
MRPAANALVLVGWLAVCLAPAQPLDAADPSLTLIVHPSRAEKLSEAEVRAIYLKQKRFWANGAPIVPINREAGSQARELFSQRLFGQDTRRAAAYWNQRYFEAGEFPPATLASDEAVLRFVAGNENAIGYVTRDDVPDAVTVVLVLH